MPPLWLKVIAIISLIAAFLSMAVILFDIVNGHRQKMAIMDIVWPVTALYFGPIAVWAYWKMGRSESMKMMDMNKQGNDQKQGKNKPNNSKQHEKGKEKPFWQIAYIGVTHCGAGCTLGDIIGEWAVFWIGLTIAGLALWPEYIVDYVLAYALGIIFQYFAIAPMRGISGMKGIWAAIKADTLSLTAFEVGLFGWMALSTLVFFHTKLHPDSPVYWFMMQIGMILGFITSYPMNWWLIKKGIKEAM